MSRTQGYDRHITVFSPDGRLYQIEYALKAVTGCGLTSVCLRGKDSVAMVVQKKTPDKLMDASYVTSVYKITPNIGAIIVGHVPDCKTLAMKIRQDAAQFKQENGYEIPVHVLSALVGKFAQVYTQAAFMRPLGCNIQLCAVDDERGPQLYAVNSSGHSFGFRANAAGAKATEANNALEKIIKKHPAGGPDQKDTLQDCIDCLQAVLGQDLKAADCEVVLMTASGFKRLTDEEVEHNLNEIAERD